MTRGRIGALVLAGLGAAILVAASMVPGTATDSPAPAIPAIDAAPLLPALPPPSPSPTTTTVPPLPPGGLAVGDSGPAVTALQEMLVARHYDPGPVDGAFDQRTAFAVMAFEKVAGMSPTGAVGPLVWRALAVARDPAPLVPDGGARRVEIDLARQLLLLYRGGHLRLVSHVSTGSGERFCAPGGCGVAVTPVGAHRFSWRVDGWRKSRLGRLYNPVYFTSDGVAIHGFPSVPTSPASHGCTRIPMHTAEYFPSLVERGDPVYVLDGVTPVEPLPPVDPDELDDGPPDDGGGSLPPPPAGWLDGDPPPTTTTTALTGQLA